MCDRCDRALVFQCATARKGASEHEQSFSLVTLWLGHRRHEGRRQEEEYKLLLRPTPAFVRAEDGEEPGAEGARVAQRTSDLPAGRLGYENLPAPTPFASKTPGQRIPPQEPISP